MIMGKDRSKFNTIRDEDHLEHVVSYLNDLRNHHVKTDKDIKTRMHQDITIILFKLNVYYIKAKPIKFPYQCEFSDSSTMEALASVLSCVDKEENDSKQEMDG